MFAPVRARHDQESSLTPSSHRSFWGRSLILVIVLVGVILGAGPSSVQAQEQKAPISLVSLRVGYQGIFKIGRWTPAWANLEAGPEGFRGAIELIVRDDQDVPTVTRRTVQLPPGVARNVPLYFRSGTGISQPQLRAIPEEGRSISFRINDLTLRRYDPMVSGQTIVLTAGQPRGVSDIPNEPGYIPAENNLRSGVVVAAAEMPDGLPGNPLGYDGMNAVVIDTNDDSVMRLLNAGRGEPLRQWVERGGHLVLAIGENWQAVLDSPLEPLLPAVPTGRQRLASLGTLEDFVDASSQIVPINGDPIEVTVFDQMESRGGRALDPTPKTPVLIRGKYGFGRVTLVGLDVDLKPFADWNDRVGFWVRALDLRQPDLEALELQQERVSRSIYQDYQNDLTTLIRSGLEQFPGVKLIGFGWVALFIFIYILLIGPGDYFFLKKVVGRMELTWITFPTLVIVVSALAYWAAYTFKGTDLRVNKIDVVDIDATRGVLRGTTFANLFSPENRSYDVSMIPHTLLDPAEDRPTAVSVGSLEEANTEGAGQTVGGQVLSWFGRPGGGYGGMDNTSRGLTFGGGGYRYTPEGQYESVRGVRVPIWSTRCFYGQWYDTAPEVVRAELVSDGNRLVGTLSNMTAVPLESAVLAYGRSLYDLGTLEVGQTVQVELKDPNPRFIRGYLNDLWNERQGSQNSEFNPSTVLRWNDLVRIVGLRRELGDEEVIPESNALADLDLSGQLQLGHAVLIASIPGSGASLAVVDAPDQFPSEQSTVLRVLLPVDESFE